MSFIRKIRTAAVGTVAAIGTSLAMAQTAPTTPLELLQSQSTVFLADTKALLFAGAGLIISALLIAKLVQSVIQFFRRG